MSWNSSAITALVCLCAGVLLIVWSVFSYREISRYRNHRPIQLRNAKFIAFTLIIWCTIAIVEPLAMAMLARAEVTLVYEVRLGMYAFTFWGPLGFTFLKAWMLYVDIRRRDDEEQWICCHVIDRRWHRSHFVVNYDMFAKPTYVLCYLTVYFLFGLLIITLVGMTTGNKMAENAILYLITIVPIGLSVVLIVKLFRWDYFNDSYGMGKEAIAYIIILVLCTTPSYVVSYWDNNYHLIIITEVVSCELACWAMVFVSVKFGVWSTMGYIDIVTTEQTLLDRDLHMSIHNGATANFVDVASLTPHRSRALLLSYFVEILNFREGFFSFSYFLMSRNKCNHLGFLVELWQFKQKLRGFTFEYCVNRTASIRRGSESAHNCEEFKADCAACVAAANELHSPRFSFKEMMAEDEKWLGVVGTQIDFSFLPNGDCVYLNESESEGDDNGGGLFSVVQSGWDIFTKYVQSMEGMEAVAHTQAIQDWNKLLKLNNHSQPQSQQQQPSPANPNANGKSFHRSLHSIGVKGTANMTNDFISAKHRPFQFGSPHIRHRSIINYTIALSETCRHTTSRAMEYMYSRNRRMMQDKYEWYTHRLRDALSLSDGDMLIDSPKLKRKSKPKFIPPVAAATVPKMDGSRPSIPIEEMPIGEALKAKGGLLQLPPTIEIEDDDYDYDDDDGVFSDKASLLSGDDLTDAQSRNITVNTPSSRASTIIVYSETDDAVPMNTGVVYPGHTHAQSVDKLGQLQKPKVLWFDRLRYEKKRKSLSDGHLYKRVNTSKLPNGQQTQAVAAHHKWVSDPQRHLISSNSPAGEHNDDIGDNPLEGVALIPTQPIMLATHSAESSVVTVTDTSAEAESSRDLKAIGGNTPVTPQMDGGCGGDSFDDVSVDNASMATAIEISSKRGGDNDGDGDNDGVAFDLSLDMRAMNESDEKQMTEMNEIVASSTRRQLSSGGGDDSRQPATTTTVTTTTPKDKNKLSPLKTIMSSVLGRISNSADAETQSTNIVPPLEESDSKQSIESIFLDYDLNDEQSMQQLMSRFEREIIDDFTMDILWSVFELAQSEAWEAMVECFVEFTETSDYYVLRHTLRDRKRVSQRMNSQKIMSPRHIRDSFRNEHMQSRLKFFRK